MENPPEGWPRMTPAVFYDDAEAAIDWLSPRLWIHRACEGRE